ncbi:hypothetical protein K501DRAFT_267189 [Backusella circina FSU 941]|nr:hypothetical protein K501DRAFT_267189 [Backusella circina FSU 941]
MHMNIKLIKIWSVNSIETSIMQLKKKPFIKVHFQGNKSFQKLCYIFYCRMYEDVLISSIFLRRHSIGTPSGFIFWIAEGTFFHILMNSLVTSPPGFCFTIWGRSYSETKELTVSRSLSGCIKHLYRSRLSLDNGETEKAKALLVYSKLNRKISSDHLRNKHADTTLLTVVAVSTLLSRVKQPLAMSCARRVLQEDA